MSRLTLTEQTQLAKLLVDRSCRVASARLKSSALLRWRYGAPIADKLLIVPQDLRTGDPSFVSEDQFGHFGLAGVMVTMAGNSPFEMAPPSEAWERALHGFGWLRHFYAANHVGARDRSIALVVEWCERYRKTGLGAGMTVVNEPAVMARRIMSWIVNAPLILDDVDHDIYDTITDRLADELIHLSASWRHAPVGQRRLEALIALLMGHLCIGGREAGLATVSRAFSAEMEQQVLADGGHISRNPQVLLDLLLDLLPLRQCFVTREQKLPDGLDAACRRMLRMLRYLRLGDGRIARFNGMSAHAIDELSTVLAYDDRPDDRLVEAPYSKYARLERDGIVAIMDVGGPPPLELSGTAAAGCLSFEMSDGDQPVFVNCGAPSTAGSEWQAAARATSSHNTLCLGGRSSARLVRHEHLETLLDGAPIRLPDGVDYKLQDSEGALEISAFHDGYYQRFKLLHRRRLMLGAGGRIVGVDRLGPQRGQLRLPQDIPFAIHFHLDKGVTCVAAVDGTSASLTLGDGSRRCFTVTGAQLSIEESVHFAEFAGPRPSLQIVLRGATFGESEVQWTMERMV